MRSFMSPSHPKAVLWDLDGELVTSSKLLFIAWREALGAEGRSYGHADHDAVFGMRNDDLLLIHPEIPAAEIARIAGTKKRHYRELVAEPPGGRAGQVSRRVLLHPNVYVDVHDHDHDHDHVGDRWWGEWGAGLRALSVTDALGQRLCGDALTCSRRTSEWCYVR
ncbi:hypothetical protein WME79_19360 [Sorangium sp. So ce726]|uniref:hypothetical protein n=1 Tax=Sorangium sp. So ce726 TaxID=3133319 RepID=UPI003F5DF9F8